MVDEGGKVVVDAVWNASDVRWGGVWLAPVHWVSFLEYVTSALAPAAQ